MWKSLIVCNSPSNFPEPCSFSHLVILLQNLITDLVILTTFLAAVAFAYAGFILLTSGGSESAKTKAKDIFLKVLKGYLWILGAWLLVYTITTVLLKPGYSLLGPP